MDWRGRWGKGELQEDADSSWWWFSGGFYHLLRWGRNTPRWELGERNGSGVGNQDVCLDRFSWRCKAATLPFHSSFAPSSFQPTDCQTELQYPVCTPLPLHSASEQHCRVSPVVENGASTKSCSWNSCGPSVSPWSSCLQPVLLPFSTVAI